MFAYLCPKFCSPKGKYSISERSQEPKFKKSWKKTQFLASPKNINFQNLDSLNFKMNVRAKAPRVVYQPLKKKQMKTDYRHD